MKHKRFKSLEEEVAAHSRTFDAVFENAESPYDLRKRLLGYQEERDAIIRRWEKKTPFQNLFLRTAGSPA